VLWYNGDMWTDICDLWHFLLLRHTTGWSTRAGRMCEWLPEAQLRKWCMRLAPIEPSSSRQKTFQRASAACCAVVLALTAHVQQLGVSRIHVSSVNFTFTTYTILTTAPAFRAPGAQMNLAVDWRYLITKSWAFSLWTPWVHKAGTSLSIDSTDLLT